MRKIAITIGINNYQYEEVPKLRGCVADAQVMQSVLHDKYSFSCSSLVDSQATQSNITFALESIAADAKQGDLIVVCYSGHGSQQGLHETWVPVDSGRTHPHENRDIIDLQLRSYVADMINAGAGVVVISDSCYSGGMDRERATGAVRFLKPDMRMPYYVKTDFDKRSSQPRSLYDISANYNLVAACAKDEVSVEWNDRGLFSFNLGHALENMPKDTLYLQFAQATARVIQTYKRQHPLFIGPTWRKLG